MALKLPKSRAEIRRIQAERKRASVEQARRSPFWRSKLERINLERLEDPAEWRKIPILDKDMLRALSDQQFYNEFCVPPADGCEVERVRAVQIRLHQRQHRVERFDDELPAGVGVEQHERQHGR